MTTLVRARSGFGHTAALAALSAGVAAGAQTLSTHAVIGWGNLHIGQFGGSATGGAALDFSSGYPSAQYPEPVGDFLGSVSARAGWASLALRVRGESSSGLAYLLHQVTGGSVSDDTLTITAPGFAGAGLVRYVVALSGTGVDAPPARRADASVFLEHGSGFLALVNNTISGAVFVTPPQPFTFGAPFPLRFTLEGQSLFNTRGATGVARASFGASIVRALVSTPADAPVVGASFVSGSRGAFPAPPPCRGDVNFDGICNFDDLSLVLAAYGTSGPIGAVAGDATFDGAVDFSDLVAVLSGFGVDCR